MITSYQISLMVTPHSSGGYSSLISCDYSLPNTPESRFILFAKYAPKYRADHNCHEKQDKGLLKKKISFSFDLTSVI